MATRCRSRLRGKIRRSTSSRTRTPTRSNAFRSRPTIRRRHRRSGSSSPTSTGRGNTISAHAIAVRDLTKSYGSVEAVRGVSLHVDRGEIFGLLGPNGARKTTLVECIVGLRKADAGSVDVAGIDATHRSSLL